MLNRHKHEVADEGGGSALLKVGLAVVAIGAAAGVTYTVVTRKKAAAARGGSSYDQSDEVVPLRSVDDLKKAASDVGEKAKAAASSAAETVKEAVTPSTDSAASSPSEDHTFQGDIDHVAHQIADSFVEDIELPDGPLPE